MKTRTILGLIAAAGFVSACASTGNSDERGIAAFKDDVRLGEEVSKICFNRTIDGFSNAKRDTVVLSGVGNKDHIVEVGGVCTNLRHAQSIAIDSTLSCVTRGDYLLVSESAFSINDGTGMGPDRCIIKKIHKWDKKANRKKEE